MKIRLPLAQLPSATWLAYAAVAVFAVAPLQSPAKVQVEPGRAYVNTLGMKFAPVAETRVLFSIWETRVQDFAAFAAATNRNWKNTGEALHPAKNISRDEADAFCVWLTASERAAGRIAPEQRYRLPTDAEWSTAAGLKEGPGTPQEKDMKTKGVYPWGRHWPAPREAGNYSPELNVDRYPGTAPVGSFPPNRSGLYDMGGNVWEWVSDPWDRDKKSGILRGASFHIHDPVVLLSSYRLLAPDLRYTSGFRVVLTLPDSGARPTP